MQICSCDNLAFEIYSMRVKDKDPRFAFGRAVRSARASAGFSQEKLADLAGIHRTYIGDVERGVRNISLINMTRIAAALKLPLSRLIVEIEKDK
jgi:transcriptional regulator with XRE-family HTH domain